MQITRTDKFKKAYQRLPAHEQERAKKAILFLAADMRHPSLQVKEIKGTGDIWEARVSLGIRMTFSLDGSAVVVRNVGEHDATLNNP